jgi:hypothetical protein
MANTAALSAAFDRARLDALGAWTADADDANLDINWAAPTDLADLAVPLKLRFHTDSGAESFDPDERMFELTSGSSRTRSGTSNRCSRW